MNWKLIFSLSLFGIIMGSLSLFGYTQGIEWILWLASGLFIAFLIAKYAPKRVFMHGLWVGVIQGILKSLVAFAGWDLYTKHNDMESFNQPSQLTDNFMMLIIGIVIGSVYGVILGLISVFFKKFIVKKPS